MDVTFPPLDLPRRPTWLTGAILGVGALVVVPWIISFGPVSAEKSGLLATAVVTTIPAVMVWIAACNRYWLPATRRALALLAFPMSITAAGNALRFAMALGLTVPSIPGFATASDLVVFFLGLVALTQIPLAPIAPGTIWRIAIDTAISFLGLAVIIFVIWELPGMRAEAPTTRNVMMVYNAIELASVFVFTLIVVRGPAAEIRTAVSWLSATVVIETAYLIAFQYAVGYHVNNSPLANSLFFADYVFYFLAAAAFMGGPEKVREGATVPTLIKMVNPIPAGAVVGVGTLLVISAVANSKSSVIILAVGTVLMSFLLLCRVLLASRESLRLLRGQSREDQRIQEAKIGLMRQMAAGISHVVNNKMTAVIGNADILRISPGADPALRGSLDSIISAARQASTLADRLRMASGAGSIMAEARRLADIIQSQRPVVEALVGKKRHLVWDLSASDGQAIVAPPDVDAILRELVNNACDATMLGGRIMIRVRDENILSTIPDAAVGPGLFTVLEVADNGQGIRQDDLPHVVEPFFTNRPFVEGRGLGLSVVQGIAASYGGGIQIDTVPGAGSTVRVFLPIAGE